MYVAETDLDLFNVGGTFHKKNAIVAFDRVPLIVGETKVTQAIGGKKTR